MGKGIHIFACMRHTVSPTLCAHEPAMIHPSITACVADPAAHYFDVTLSIQALTLAHSPCGLSCWIPGSYLLREFARHIVSLHAQADGAAIAVTKTDKHS